MYKENSLANRFPHLMEEWDYDRNIGLDPYKITYGSNKKAYWRCLKNNEHPAYSANVHKRTQTNPHGCPFCSNQQVCKVNSFASTHPELAEEWHPTLNKEKTPNDFTAGSGFDAYWKCPNNEDHPPYCAKIARRTTSTEKSKCPYCSGQKVCEANSLAKTHPDIAKEWHPTLNKNKTPYDFTAGTKKNAWWKCPHNEEHPSYRASILNRKNGSKCPYCAGKLVCDANSIARTHPELSKEWHPTLNEDKTPKDFTAGRDFIAYWICPIDRNHSPYPARIGSRTKKIPTGCPICKESKGEKRIREFLIKHLVPHKQGYPIDDCRNKKSLPFDFVIWGKNQKIITLIEFDGIQHYKPIDQFGGEEAFQKTKYNDAIKTKYCKDNKIPLIRIKYTKFHQIEEILIEKFMKIGIFSTDQSKIAA